MPATLVLVHTVPSLVQQFEAWCAEQLPGVRVLHVLDEPLLEWIRQRGHDDVDVAGRLSQHVTVAEAIGAAGVIVTCSSVSLSAATVRKRAGIPLFTIDEAVAEAAVRAGRRIAVVATAPTALGPSQALLEVTAARLGRPVDVVPVLVDGAMAALRAGDGVTHDRLVAAAVRDAASDVEVVLLAQATMTRVLATLEDDPVAVPVLASPPFALAEVRRVLAGDVDRPSP